MSLPSGAIRLNWIQSTGTQYVDTGFVPNQDSGMELTFALPADDYSNNNFFGSRKSTSAQAFTFSTVSGKWRFGYNNSSAASAVVSDSERHTVTISKNVCSLDGVVIDERTYVTFSGYASITIGAIKAASMYDGAGKVYSCKIYDNGTLVRNFIPCKLSDGSVGLWDDVEGKFYGNAGTGTFVAGPAAGGVVMDKSEIVELEYIESNGTQYIDSAFNPNQDTRVRTHCAFPVSSSSNAIGLFGARTSGSAGKFQFVTAYSQYRTDYHNTNTLIPSVSDYGSEKFLVDKNKNITTLNDEHITSQTYAEFVCAYPVYIFATNNGGSAYGFSSAKVYDFQIYDNGLLMRDYVPAKTIEGEIGLYDRVFKEFYRNAGTGSFIAGPEMVHEDYTELEYVESSGEQYADTGVTFGTSNTKLSIKWQDKADYSQKVLFGSGDDTQKGYFVLYGADLYLGAASVGTLNVSDRTQAHELVLETEATGKWNYTLDGVAVTGSYTAPINYIYSVYLLTQNPRTERSRSALLYYAQLWDNNVLRRSFVPMLHPSGVAGLWDSVNERFYASATTTDLIAGPEKVKAPKAPADFRVVSETGTEVALAWDADENAVGYRLYRDGTLLADLAGTEYTDTATPFGSYTYQVRGYNEHGEGDAAELVVFLTPENPILWLVTDRTQADVDARNSKGVYQFVDLNRVGAAVEYLRKRLLDAGVLADVSPRMDWTDTMWMSAGEAKVYLDNVKTMRAALAMPNGTPAAPADMAKLTYAEANHIETFLVILDTLLTDMVFAYRHCGVTVCGMGGLIL